MVKSLSVGLRQIRVDNSDKTSLEANEPLALVLRGSPFGSTIYTASSPNILIDGKIGRESGVATRAVAVMARADGLDGVMMCG